MILRMKVKNFKSIEEIDLNFGALNVLIGKNGAGKTTLISIISIIKEMARGGNINVIANKIAPYGEFFNVNTRDNTASFEVIIQSKVNNFYRYSFSVRYGSGSDGSSEKNKYYFAEEELDLLKDVDGEIKERIFYRNINDDGHIYGSENDKVIPQRADSSVSVLSTYTHKHVQDVAMLLSEYSVIWMRQGSSISGNLQYVNNLDLTTIDGVAVGLYLRDLDNFNEAMKIIGEIIPGFTAPIINPLPLGLDEDDDSPNHLGFIVNWNDNVYAKGKTFSSSVLSGGNSRVIYLILSLYYSSARTCFVAEEIENGMHLGRLSDLMDKLRMIGKNRQIQLFLTTHNHLILEDLLPKEVILAKLSDHGSRYVRLSETEEYADIKDDLGRDPTGREMADSGLFS